MSEEWECYLCQMGEHKASIFFDHGIRESIDHIAPHQLLKVRVVLKYPRSDGLSSDEEYQNLCALEDDLQSVVKQHGGLYVGRVTVDGKRYLHIFVDGEETDWAARLISVGERHGYELRYVLKNDPKHDGYWQDLFPSDDDWQVVQDLKVLNSVAERGDDGSAIRRIDHWVYFPSRESADQFSQWVKQCGYSFNALDSTDDSGFRVRFAHEGTLRLADITSHTIQLNRKASELGGDYDGWETPVCKPAS